jgi:hypothetical protein
LCTLAGNSRVIHQRVPSGWCAWCGQAVSAGVVIAGTVLYHEFCRWRRAGARARFPRNSDKFSERRMTESSSRLDRDNFSAVAAAYRARRFPVI